MEQTVRVTPSSSGDWTPHEEYILRLATNITGSISLAAASYVFLTFLMFRRTHPSCMALFYSGCSVCFAICFLLHPLVGKDTKTQMGFCIAQGVLLQFFANACTLWWVCIAINLYATVVRKVQEPERYLIYYHIVAWGVPFILALIPGIQNAYTYSRLWCWIDDNGNNWRQFVFYYIPMTFCVVIGIGIWLRVIWVAWRRHQKREAKKIMKRQRRSVKVDELEESVTETSEAFFQGHIMRHICFVVFFAVILIIPFVQRSIQAAGGPQANWFPLILAHVLVQVSQGMITFIAFGLSWKNLKLWLLLFARPQQVLRRLCCTPDRSSQYGNALRSRVDGSTGNDSIEEWGGIIAQRSPSHIQDQASDEEESVWVRKYEKRFG